MLVVVVIFCLQCTAWSACGYFVQVGVNGSGSAMQECLGQCCSLDAGGWRMWWRVAHFDCTVISQYSGKLLYTCTSMAWDSQTLDIVLVYTTVPKWLFYFLIKWGSRSIFLSGNHREVNSTWYPEIEEPIKSREKHYSLVLYILMTMMMRMMTMVMMIMITMMMMRCCRWWQCNVFECIMQGIVRARSLILQWSFYNVHMGTCWQGVEFSNCVFNLLFFPSHRGIHMHQKWCYKWRHIWLRTTSTWCPLQSLT